MSEGNSIYITTSEMADKHEKPAASLLSLPPELRTMIYEYVIGDIRGDDGRIDLNNLAIPIPKLAQASQQLRQEVIPIVAANMSEMVWVVTLPSKVQLSSSAEATLSWWMNSERSTIRRSDAIPTTSAMDGFDTTKAKEVHFSLPRARFRRSNTFGSTDPTVQKGVTWNLPERGTQYLIATPSRERSPPSGGKEEKMEALCKRMKLEIHERCSGMVGAKERIEKVVTRAGFDGFTLEDVAAIIGAYMAAPLQ
ncbi:hypothetical protein LTR37_001889 [Vermiconidia calcicola]|uniref:Uncharacterized protein n=1 Tax=Vermiconidia calcicola TaxID=1690605 RepID=A0ACC3NUI7_9PEZI|nr:hypothetical protein LTR37_001889 [Vermiconidia calcicola]